MKKINFVYLASIFAASAVQASVPCDNFQISINNQLSDDLLGTTVKLNGASLKPDGVQTLKSKATQTFIVSKTESDVPMYGEFSFHTISIPTKDVSIKFDLKNFGLICQHDDKTEGGDFSVEKNRSINKVEYTIVNK
jgi:hypothetical protein